MKPKRSIFGLAVTCLALPLVATAVVSANQWASQPASLNLDAANLDVIDMGMAEERLQKVSLDQAGAFEGRVSVTPGQGEADVQVMLVRGNAVRYMTKTNAEGIFDFAGVEPGTYSFIAKGTDCVLAYGLTVVQGEGDQLAKDFVDVIAVSTTGNVDELLEDMQSKMVRGSATPVELSKLGQGKNQVQLRNGVLTGAVNSMVQNAKPFDVQILQNGEVIASTTTDANGKFKINGLKSGVYSVIAKGETGYAAIGFEAYDAPEVAIKSEFAVALVLQDNQDDELIVNAAPDQPIAGDGTIVYEPVYVTEFPPVEFVTESTAFGGAGGGFAGNFGTVNTVGPLRGGGIGGGGRLGRLAILGGAIAGIVALADDADPGPASPITP